MGGVDLGGATATPPDNRGKKGKRGEDDNEHQWWEERCNSVAMDAIDNQLGVTERQWTRDNNDNDGQGRSFEMEAGEGMMMIATATTVTSRMEAGDGGGWRRV